MCKQNNVKAVVLFEYIMAAAVGRNQVLTCSEHTQPHHSSIAHNPQEPAQLQNWHRTYTGLQARAGEVIFKSKMIFLPSWAPVKTAPRKKLYYLRKHSGRGKSLVVDPGWIEPACNQQIPAFVHTGHSNKVGFSLAKWGKVGSTELYIP